VRGPKARGRANRTGGESVQSRPTVSFVVPAYNEAAYLRPTLLAILRETRSVDCPTEIVVVDNASTDATRKVAESIPNVRVVDEPRKGLVQARQAGYLATTGQLVANIDADTVLPEGWLKKALAIFAAEPELAGVSGPYTYYDVPWHTNALVGFFYRWAFLSYFTSRFILRVGSMMQGGNFVVRRSALDKIGGFNPDFSFYGEDTELACRLNKVGGVRFTFALRSSSSGRRLNAEGIFRVFWVYTLNYVWATYFRRPFTRDWRDFRDTGGGQLAAQPQRAEEARPADSTFAG
jgi:glycosyltransferase involved in cell wall biosynthesis